MMRDFLQWHALGSGFVPDVVKKISSTSSSTFTIDFGICLVFGTRQEIMVQRRNYGTTPEGIYEI